MGKTPRLPPARRTLVDGRYHPGLSERSVSPVAACRKRQRPSPLCDRGRRPRHVGGSTRRSDGKLESCCRGFVLLWQPLRRSNPLPREHRSPLFRLLQHPAYLAQRVPFGPSRCASRSISAGNRLIGPSSVSSRHAGQFTEELRGPPESAHMECIGLVHQHGSTRIIFTLRMLTVMLLVFVCRFRVLSWGHGNIADQRSTRSRAGATWLGSLGWA